MKFIFSFGPTYGFSENPSCYVESGRHRLIRKVLISSFQPPNLIKFYTTDFEIIGPQGLVGGSLQRDITKRDVTIIKKVDPLSEAEFHGDSETALRFT